VIPISLVLIEGVIRTQSWNTANAIATLPPMICGVVAFAGAQRSGHTTRRAWWWVAVAVVAYYARWIVIAGVVIGLALS
jgi:hypothetical protein